MNFLTNAKELKGFIGVNDIVAVSQLPSIPRYWNCSHVIGKVGIQNIFMRTRYQEVTFLTTQNKTKQVKAIRLDQSSIT